MIKIYLLDFTGEETPKAKLSSLPVFLEKTKNPHLRRERIFSYMLLCRAYRDVYSGGAEKNFLESGLKEYPEIPEILRDENGRPYFSGTDIDFNISHDGNMAALVISDEGRVGIDIQCVSQKVSAGLKEKISKLFEDKILSDITLGSDSLSGKAWLMNYSDDEGIFDIDDTGRFTSDIRDFFSLWTAYEAISKADGRGISLFSEIDFLKEKFLLKRARVTDKLGNIYALCVCKKA